MCKQVFYFCHCCKIRAIDANNWKSFYKYEDYRFFERVYDPSHLLNIVFDELKIFALARPQKIFAINWE